MIQVRLGMFETNSSSTHSLIITTREEYDKLLSGEYLIDRCSEKIVPRAEAVKEIEENWPTWHEDLKGMFEEPTIEDAFREDSDFDTLEHYMNDDYLESYEEEYTTPSGDRIVVFGKYGYDS